MRRTVEGLPWEWRALPLWVKAELVSDAEHLSCYSSHLQKLVEHNDLMGDVWESLKSASPRFGFQGRVQALLEILHLAVFGLDPGLPRADHDRQLIAEELAKHVQGALRQLERLGTGAEPSRYPIPVEGTLDIAATEWVDEQIGGHFVAARRRIQAGLEAAGVDAAARTEILSVITSVQWDIEVEITHLYMDPKPSLRALVAATADWAANSRWERNEIIQHIAQELRSWLGGSQHEATATLVTIVCGTEVSEDAVAGVLKRAARKLQGSEKSRSPERPSAR